MENAELVGLSRQITLRRQMDVVANNLANMNTTGFKAESSLFEEYLRTGGKHNGFERADRPVSYVVDDRTLTDLSAGAMVTTGKPTDLALQEGQFFTIQTQNGDRYTRNGAFVIDSNGVLTTTEGNTVSAAGGGQITFAPEDTDIAIARDGTVSTEGGIRGQLAIVEITDEDSIERLDNSLFAAETQPAVNPGVEQGVIEKSNVQAVVEVARMIEITRAYERTAKQIQRQDEIRRDAIRKLGELNA
jgi:flagellar basal-body rod protein FlgF